MAELIDPTIEAGVAAVSLPAPRTALVGRERELEALLVRLREPTTPLVTITGPGGVGKTRLAIHAAWAMRDAFEGQVVFVSLADVVGSDWLVRRVAHALALPGPATQLSEQALIDALRDRMLLLVLDNLEQISDAGQLLTRIVEAAPDVKLLVTSRIAMRIRGEVEFPLAPLATPRSVPHDPPPLQELERNSAVTLLVERARAVNPAFALTTENAADIARICERLDGLPLAIELAAARLKLLTPAALVARLDHRLRILGGGARDLPDRQQNLRQTIAWSYDLLDASERSVFRALAVFAGGFDLAAAAAVLGADENDPELLDWLGSLVDQSLLLRRDESGSETRLFMLETIREFGIEQLHAYGEEEQVRAAHAAYYRRFAEEKVNRIGQMSSGVADELEHEMANIHHALDWFIEREEADGAVSLVLAMSKFWIQRGYLVEGSRLMERAVEFVDRVEPVTQSRMLRFSAWFICIRGELDEALDRSARGLAMSRSLDDRNALAEALTTHGVILHYRGEIEPAKVAWIEALDLADVSSDMRAGLLNNLGVAATLQRRLDEAERYFELSRTETPADTRAGQSGHHLINLAEVAMERGDLERGRSLINEWFTDRNRLRNVEIAMSGAWSAAKLAFLEGDRERAARLLGWSDEMRQRLGLSSTIRDEYDQRLRGDLTRQLGESIHASLAAEGARMTTDEVVALAASPRAVASPARQSPRERPAESGLTARELEVARLVAEGMSNREIADALFISARTAQTHVTNILAKLDLESRAALAAYVVRHELDGA